MNRINIKLFLVILVIVILGGYFLYQAKGYLLGPQIFIESPKVGEVSSTSYLEVKGRALNVSSLSLNGRQIITDGQGNFSEGLLLARGYNIIGLTAADKFGRVKKEKREVVLQ